jgi:hypothetical protein
MRLQSNLVAAFVLSLASLATASLVLADVWTWKDAAGEPHYSDRPIDGAVRVPTVGSSRGSSLAPASTAGATPHDPNSKLAALNEGADAALAKQRAEAAVQQDLARKQEEQCKQAKAAYDNSIAARRIIKTGSNGESGFMTDPEAEEYRVKARTDMESACGNGKGQ